MIHLYFFAFILLGGKPYHVVKKGETLYSISKEYHFSLEDIRAKNKMTEASIIAIGDTIFFPTEEEIEKKEEQYIFHIVQKGETIFWISRNNTQISFDELIRLNHINSNFEINVGQKIIIGYKKNESTAPKAVLKPDQKNKFTDIKPKPTLSKDSIKTKPTQAAIVKPQTISPLKKDTIAKPKTIDPIKKDTISIKKMIEPAKPDSTKIKASLPSMTKPSDHLKIPAHALKKDTIIAKKQIAVIKIDSTKTKAPLPSIAKQPDHLKVPAPALKKDTIIVKKDFTAGKLDSTKAKAPLPSIAKQPDHLKVPAPIVKKDTISIQKIAKAIDTNKIAEDQHDYQKLFENDQKGKSNKCLAASLNSGKDFALYNDATVGSYIKVRNLKTNLSTYLKVIGKLPNFSREKQVCLKMSQAAADKISATGKMFLVEIEH